ncbi:MAG TPA: ABC transporter ATP-binding protein [Spirochaetota bacterium]|jgi:NitT/TauT family transport system ATP-binding protein|nr:ABC transporter ATP-binding protein [Spirochaetota bacterium]HOK93225.1 ABC transporter ATP-binding protein [Spirochaetota bacterium]HPD78953.1 ABC transporter ATP-binding protein [Spirochaetota bacterium]HPP96033.1 ABC transporter ATP-binding protein [Spirochaetota bacterium]HPX92282.1 ABC transporter ATP-binding protein [Spirochaetota bacterium]
MVSGEIIKVHSLSKKFSGINVLENINFAIKKGESLSIIGPSGCGKTTLLYIIGGLLRPDAGQVLINGREVKGAKDDVAFILQDYGLLPWKTVRENVELGLKIKGVEKTTRDALSLRALQELNIEKLSLRFPSNLSGGEKQRVAIARALVSSPEILLMDEPFSSLDTLTREKLQNTIKTIQIEKKLTMVIVTHSIEEGVFLGDKIIIMNSHPGRVEVMIENKNRRSLDFRGSQHFYKICNKVRGIIEKGERE